MLISLFLLTLIAFSGLALTYLVTDDESFMWRLSAGSIVGSTLYGVIIFVVCSGVGFTPAAIIGSLVVTMLPLLLLRRPYIQSRFLRDWAKAKGKLEGINLQKTLRFAYYAFFFIVFFYFFERAVYQLSDGLYTGGYQNLGDLSFHLGAIFSFTEGASFPPQNPSWAGAKFSYPFMADLLAACFVKLGADFKEVIFVQDVTWAFALMVILERFAARITNDKLAGRIAPAILFFSGGLGFIWFFHDISAAAKGVSDFLWHLPTDYTIRNDADAAFRWGNPMTVLFITQRGILFGMPLTILVLQYFWRIFSGAENESVENDKSIKDGIGTSLKNFFTLSHFPLAPFLVGLTAGTLPLVHLHSLAVLFIVSVFLLGLRPSKWPQWIAFGIGVAVIAVPELIWSITGSATETTKFFGWHFGWDKRDNDFMWFWLKNTGITIPAVIGGLYLLWNRWKSSQTDGEAEKNGHAEAKKKHRSGHPQRASTTPDGITLLYFYLPFAFLFILSNVAKLAPWEWDNIKILIYWFVGSIPFIAYMVAWLWEQGKVWQAVAAACFIALTLAGAIDVWRVADGQIKNGVFNSDSMKLAEMIKQKTPRGALFLNGPVYNSTVLLSGRQSLMRYPGHLSSYGIDYSERENDVKKIYAGGPEADTLLKKYNIEYVVVTPEEEYALHPNEDYFKKFPVIAESGKYRVYQVKS